MKTVKTFLGTTIIVLAISLSSGCQRSGAEISDDTKTAGRHIGRGFKALVGQKKDSRQIYDPQEFTGPLEDDFIPIGDHNLYRQLSLKDPKTLEGITATSALPQSKQTPGEANSSIPSIEKFKTPKDLNLENIFQTIFFKYNDFSLESKKNNEIIKNIAKYIKSNPNLFIFVEGHCDERGSSSYNLALGSRRSNSVRNMLIKEGVPIDNIFTISYGKERPLMIGSDETAHSKNRRAEFKLFTKK